jgi:hypothetical protein
MAAKLAKDVSTQHGNDCITRHGSRRHPRPEDRVKNSEILHR